VANDRHADFPEVTRARERKVEVKGSAPRVITSATAAIEK